MTKNILRKKFPLSTKTCQGMGATLQLRKGYINNIREIPCNDSPVCFDLGHSKSVTWILLQHELEQTLQLRRQVHRHVYWLFGDVVQQKVEVLTFERVGPSHYVVAET